MLELFPWRKGPTVFEDIGSELKELRRNGLYRKMRLVSGEQGTRVVIDGRELLLLCSNNYLGLANHPCLKEASKTAVDQYGTGSGAARLVSGNMELHEALERRIAAFKGTEAALVFNSGYAANTGIIPGLVGRGDLIFSDRLNHASIIDGALLSRAKLIRYPHNDTDALRRLLENAPTGCRRLIVTDGVFSMDGDIAPIRELVSLKEEFGAVLMIDDAHATGVLGAGGRGTAELCGVAGSVDIQMGTFGKGLGSYGAYVAASREVIDYLINRSRSFIFSTSLPPAVLAASIAAIDLIDSPVGAELRQALQGNTSFFRGRLTQAGFDTCGSSTQIVPVLVGDAERTMEFTARLLEQGIFVQGIRPPTVPAGTSRLRCTIMAIHKHQELEQAVEAICSVGRRLNVI